MATLRVPAVMSLSTDGWITEPKRMLDILLADFFVSEESQSKWYSGKVVSLPALVQKQGNRPDDFVALVRSSLEQHISPHFAQTDITVRWTPMPGETTDNSRYNVTVEITAILNGVRVNLAEGLEIDNSKMKRIVEVANG